MILARMRRSERERAERARAALGARCASFTGDVVDSVTYVEVDYENCAPAWDGDPTFDSLDLGAELELRSGRLMGLTWGGRVRPHGLRHDRDRWSNRGGHRIEMERR